MNRCRYGGIKKKKKQQPDVLRVRVRRVGHRFGWASAARASVPTQMYNRYVTADRRGFERRSEGHES